MPPKEDFVVTLNCARAMSDRALKPFREIHVVGVEAQLDNKHLAALKTRVGKLEYFVNQFRGEQACVVMLLANLKRLAELETVDGPIVTSMESMYYQIEPIESQCVPADKS